MLLTLNAGFGELIGAPDLALIKSLGLQAVRQDAVRKETPDPAAAPALVSEIAAAGLMGNLVIPMWDNGLCQETAHAVAGRAVELGLVNGEVALEAGNEEDLSGKFKAWTRNPKGWAALVRDVLTIAGQHHPGIPVVSGGISSVSKDALRWLEQSGVVELPVIIGYHQYRSTDPDQPLKGYSSRGEEFQALQRVTAGRRLWCTESGWHDSLRESGHWPCKKRWRYSPSEVAQCLHTEMRLNEDHGAEVFTLYQLNDGPDPDYDQDCFGIRDYAGNLKPSAHVVARYA